MKLMHIEFLIPVVILSVIFSLFLAKKELAFFKWIEDHWFYKRSRTSKVSTVFFLVGMFLCAIAALDLRGPEENIAAQTSKQKTLILIDSSSSMLAEDVRPNRFRKSIMLAKHYVKKAVGQHISVAVFSDTQKKIVPFTNDTDLVDARLSSLEELNIARGGTSLKLAVQEAKNWLKVENKGVPKGNILIFTDAENHEDFGDLSNRDDVNVAVVGVGTLKGGVIPLRDKRGVIKGKKTFQGKEVVTKLDEDYLKKLAGQINNYRYWTASSYSLPTQDIIDFFSYKFEEQLQKENVKIRPVLSSYILVPAVIFLIFSFLLRSMKSFVLPILCLFHLNSFSQPKKPLAPVEKEKTKSEQTQYLENLFKSGKMNDEQMKDYASQLLKDKFYKEASKLYEEMNNKKISKGNKEDIFNQGASQIGAGDVKSGLETYKKLYNYLKNNPDEKLKKMTSENMLKAIQVQAEQEKKKKEEQKEENQNQQNKEKDSKDKKGDNKKDSQGQNKKSGESLEGDSGDEKKDSKDKEDKDKSEQDKKEDEQKNNDESEKNDKKDESKNQNDSSNKQKKKVPALLKQLMQDDNKLQKKMIDASTSKTKDSLRKDW